MYFRLWSSLLVHGEVLQVNTNISEEYAASTVRFEVSVITERHFILGWG
jgi:hypothetical protein